MAKQSIVVNVDHRLKNDIRRVAEEQNRTLTGQVTYILTRYIKEYEERQAAK